MTPEATEHRETGLPPISDDVTRTHNGGAVVKAPAVLPEIEGYEILDELGRDGMGVVYHARQLAVCILVALVFNTHPSSADFVTLPEEELLSAEFSSVAWGPAALSRTDVPGPAVRFSFIGLGAGSTGVKDDYMVSDIGQVLPSHGNGDFSIFDRYTLVFRNADATGTVWVSLILNTGFTGVSGIPSSDPSNDTFWQGPWIGINAGQRATLALRFDNATPYGITDNKPPHTKGGESWPDGVATSINGWDQTEVSAIGFQVADFSGLNPIVELDVQAAVGPRVNNSAGATDIQGASATLRGELTSTGTSETVLWVSYGTNDAGTVSGGWVSQALFGSGLPTNTYSTNVTALIPETTYYYRFAASNDTAVAWSDAQSFLTGFGLGQTVSNLEAIAIGPNAVELVWTEAFSTETGFVIQRANIIPVFATVTTVAADATSYSDSGLLPGVKYYYRVAVTNSLGLSAWSDTVSATTSSGQGTMFLFR